MTRSIIVLFYFLVALSATGCVTTSHHWEPHHELRPQASTYPNQHSSIEEEHQRVFVSFLLNQTGQIMNPVVRQVPDEHIRQKAIQVLTNLHIEPLRTEEQSSTIEMTMPITLRDQANQPDLSDFLDQIPILVGSMENLVDEIQYPERAKRASLEGRVTVAFIVDKNGTVRYPTVIQGLGAGCDEEALRAVRLARFSPGQLNGAPVNVITSLTFIFTLS